MTDRQCSAAGPDDTPTVTPPEAPTHAEIAESYAEVPMFRQPSQLPGRAKTGFSPMEFFALSRVQRDDVSAESDDALWLTEEPCPRVAPEGIELDGRLFYDDALQPYVDTRLKISSKELRIRYDRALLARGVLDEVRVYRVEPDQSYREICRCRPRDAAHGDIDMNQVMHYHAQYVEVLLATISNAEGEVFTRNHGEVALAKFRDEQAARERRRRSDKPRARVAEPIRHKDRKEREREEVERQSNELANRVASSKKRKVEEPDDAPDAAPLAVSTAAPESSDRALTKVAAPVAPPDADPDLPTDSLALRLGGTVGIAPRSDDDE